jgi:hypothetical protein
MEANTQEAAVQEQVAQEVNTEQQVQEQQAEQQNQNIDREAILQQFLTENEVSLEDIAAFKATKQKETEEKEAPLRKQKEWADMIGFGVKQNLISKDDILTYEQLSKMDDRQIVFDKFKSEFKNEEGLEGEELQEAINWAFEEEYNLGNERAKAKAEKLLKAEADAIRGEVGSKVNSVQSEYSKLNTVRAMKQQHEEILNSFATQKSITQTVEIDGESVDIEVPLELNVDDVKSQLTSKEGQPLLDFMYGVYKNSPDMAADVFKKFVESTSISQKNFASAVANAVMAKMDETYKAKYLKGSNAPFRQSEAQAGEETVNTEFAAYKKMRG